MSEQNRPTEAEVRALVGRIVDATLAANRGAPVAGAPAPASTAAPASAPAAAPAPAGGRVTIAIGGDHGGYALKDAIGTMLTEAGYAVTDCGTNGPAPVDYPDIAHAVARLVVDGGATHGIVVDGAGIGSCMAANKVPGIRASLCYDISTARNAREHNHANVLTLGSGLIGKALAFEIVRTWLGTEWAPGRHAARVGKIIDIEARYMKPTEGSR